MKVSEACRYCYAERDVSRFAPGLWGADASRKIAAESTWNNPLRWDRKAAADGVRRRVFCASLSDVFEDRRDLDEPRARLWGLIEATPNLDWLLLTKRPEAVVRLAPGRWVEGSPDNVWVGTTVENQAAADERIPHLLLVPARIRFLSCEPLLGPVDFAGMGSVSCSRCLPRWLGGKGHPLLGPDSKHNGIQWVIAGGESGAAARPMHPAWVRSLRDQCAAAGVPFHFKQWGEWSPRAPGDGRSFDSLNTAKHALVDMAGLPNATRESAGTDAAPMSRVGKKAAGRLLDGVLHDAFPVQV